MTRGLSVEVEHRVGSLHLQASFTFPPGRSALWGPSGAGKSTLLRVIAGLLRPHRARITLDGRTLLDTAARIELRPRARGLGLITQQAALFPHLSVEQNVRFGLRALPAREQARCVDAMLNLLEIEGLRRRFPALLSGGERQRVALARALAPGPRLLLLDEPFSALDGERKAALWATLNPYLSARQISTLLVSHDAGEVWAQSDAVVRMENGVAREQGSPSAILGPERDRVLRQFGAGE